MGVVIPTAASIPMSQLRTVFAAAFICFAASTGLYAQLQPKEMTWDRSAAIKSVDRAQVMESLKPLYEMARSGEDATLITALSGIASNQGMPDPTRDYLLYKFTLGLGDLDAGAVGPKVIEWLSGYEPATWVAHDHHPRMAVPLFNVRAAARGVNNGWERQKGERYASELLGDQPERFISEYLAASVAGKRGFIDAIDGIAPEQSAELGRSALQKLDSSPALMHVATRAAMKAGDFKMLQRAIALGEGPGLTRALREAAAEFTADETAELLKYTLQTESSGKASLAMALLGPGVLDQPAVQSLLFDALNSKSLGASAALVLGSSTNPVIQSRLQQVASTGEGLQKQRAQMAVSFEPAGRVD